MNIGVLGTGMVGRALAGKLVELGHGVWMGTRDPAHTLSQKYAQAQDGEPFAAWHDAHPRVNIVTFAAAAAAGELVINATNGSASLDALNSAGADYLDGKVLVDVSNPLDFSHGMPPSLSVSNTDSLAEQIQRAFPRTKVVKTLNTVTASLMVDPGRLGGGSHSVFVSGNDAEAKAAVCLLLAEFGWKDIIDLGDLTTARGVEMYLPLWLRLWGALGSGMINIKVVR